MLQIAHRAQEHSFWLGVGGVTCVHSEGSSLLGWHSVSYGCEWEGGRFPRAVIAGFASVPGSDSSRGSTGQRLGWGIEVEATDVSESCLEVRSLHNLKVRVRWG